MKQAWDAVSAWIDALVGTMSFGEAALWLLLENALVFLAALGFGALLVRFGRRRRVTAPAGPIEAREIALALTTVALNAAITVVGLWLYRRGIIVIRRDHGWFAVSDVFVLFLAMDLGMYVMHRVSHLTTLFPYLHAPHHRYTRLRPLTLFVLHPSETLIFGLMWLVLLWMYSASWLGIASYLTLNLLFGVVAHTGVEPMPPWLRRAFPMRLFVSSAFHAHHHHDQAHNFGFYTQLWDRLFGTRAEAAPATVSPPRG